MIVLLSLAIALSDATAARSLERELDAPGTSYLLTRLNDSQVLASNWPDPDKPTPLGSLVKPFTALAYGETHEYRWPRFRCRGESDHCWFAPGHGELSIEDALAHSCNAWFQQLADRTDAADVARVLARFGVRTPPGSVTPQTLIGRGDAWPLSPVELLNAYCEMALRVADSAVKPLLRGMALSARSGTAAGLGTQALAKTGTAPCGHTNHVGTDGFVVVLFPLQQPRFALLVRMHGLTGASVASRTGRFFRTMQKGL
jgi:cell division protein FtsI/penicillin-binding protein 2